MVQLFLLFVRAVCERNIKIDSQAWNRTAFHLFDGREFPPTCWRVTTNGLVMSQNVILVVFGYALIVPTNLQEKPWNTS
jgi:hypothetical protein